MCLISSRFALSPDRLCLKTQWPREGPEPFSHPTQSLTLHNVLIRQTASNGVLLYLSPLLSAIGVAHGFSTRVGGVSLSPFDSLNLGNSADGPRDEAENLRENLNRLQSAANLADRRRVWVRQVHGNRVAIARDCSFESGAEADAIISNDATSCMLVRVADCVPILLTSPDGSAVAAVHAGWRGVLSGVVPAAIKALGEVANIPPHQIVAAIGPCISHEYFEVGPEVVAEFVRLFGAGPRWADRQVDLPEAVAIQLQDCGVANARIDRTDRCTARDRDEFFSHRRDRGITGRMAAIIAPIDSSPVNLSRVNS
jgi:polyphenol oxidase